MNGLFDCLHCETSRSRFHELDGLLAIFAGFNDSEEGIGFRVVGLGLDVLLLPLLELGGRFLLVWLAADAFLCLGLHELGLLRLGRHELLFGRFLAH